MRSRGDSSLRIVSEGQARAFASAALDYGAETDRDHHIERLAARISAIVAADVMASSARHSDGRAARRIP
jgi:hypothetical protein